MGHLKAKLSLKAAPERRRCQEEAPGPAADRRPQAEPSRTRRLYQERSVGRAHPSFDCSSVLRSSERDGRVAGRSGLGGRSVSDGIPGNAAMNHGSYRPKQALLDDMGVDWLGVVVSRSDVEKNDISATLSTLSSLLNDNATVRRFQGRVNVSFDGFNEDRREIYEIPEIRRFCAKLDRHFPYWLYFLPTADSSLKMMTFCLCRVEKQGPGLVTLNGTDLGRFLYSHFGAMNELFDRHSLDEATNQAISNNILKYFNLG